MLDQTAGPADADLVWERTLPIGVSKRDHYQGFAEMVEVGAQKIYDATKRLKRNSLTI